MVGCRARLKYTFRSFQLHTFHYSHATQVLEDEKLTSRAQYFKKHANLAPEKEDQNIYPTNQEVNSDNYPHKPGFLSYFIPSIIVSKKLNIKDSMNKCILAHYTFL